MTASKDYSSKKDQNFAIKDHEGRKKAMPHENMTGFTRPQ